MQQDARGVPVTGGSKFACDQYEIALRQFQSYVGDPIATIDAALERLEKRIWIGVYGVAAFLLAQGAEALMQAAMR